MKILSAVAVQYIINNDFKDCEEAIARGVAKWGQRMELVEEYSDLYPIMHSLNKKIEGNTAFQEFKEKHGLSPKIIPLAKFTGTITLFLVSLFEFIIKPAIPLAIISIAGSAAFLYAVQSPIVWPVLIATPFLFQSILGGRDFIKDIKTNKKIVDMVGVNLKALKEDWITLAFHQLSDSEESKKIREIFGGQIMTSYDAQLVIDWYLFRSTGDMFLEKATPEGGRTVQVADFDAHLKGLHLLYKFNILPEDIKDSVTVERHSDGTGYSFSVQPPRIHAKINKELQAFLERLEADEKWDNRELGADEAFVKKVKEDDEGDDEDTKPKGDV